MKLNYIRYGLILAGLSILLPVLLFVIDYLSGFDLNSSAISIIPTMAAAVYEGQRYDVRNDPKPGSGTLWQAALRLTGVSVLVNAIFGSVAFFIMPDLLAILGGQIGLFIGAALFFSVVLLLINRYFLGQGVRNQLKAIEAQSKK